MTTQEAAVIVADVTKTILSKQSDKKEWNQDEHRALLVILAKNQAEQVDGKELVENLKVLFTEASCGNASAYRQSLKNSDGSVMFPKRGDVVKTEYV